MNGRTIHTEETQTGVTEGYPPEDTSPIATEAITVRAVDRSG
jgi:hypothetical protein